MAHYLLLNKQELWFLGTTHQTKGCFGVRENKKDAIVNFVPITQTAASKAFSEKILEHRSNNQMSLNLGIKVFISESIPTGSTHGAGHVEVEAKGENHILHKIISMTQGNIKLSWVVTDFGVMTHERFIETDPFSRQLVSWRSPICEIFRSRRFLPTSHPGQPATLVCSSVASLSNIPPITLDFWKNGKPFMGTFSIFVVIENSPTPEQFFSQVGASHFQKCYKMLHESVETDTHLVSKDGRIAKCHRAILIVSSKILERKLSGPNGQQEVDVMKHLSLECIQAVLSYIYYGGISKYSASNKMAIQVLGVAIEFQIVDLIRELQNYFLRKSHQDFTAKQAVKFYVITKSGLIENNFYPICENGDDANMNSDVEFQSQEGEEEKENEQDAVNESEQEENDNGSRPSEQENGNSDEDNDDESAPERSPTIQVQHGLGKGRLLSTKRRAIYNSEMEIGKRVCVNRQFYKKLFKTPRNPIEDNSASETSSEISCSGLRNAVNNEVFQNDLAIINVHNTNDNLRYLHLLGNQANEMILWHLNNNRDPLLDAVDYLPLMKSREVLLEFLKLSIRSYPQQLDGNA